METVDKSKLPLLLLDNASMARVMNKGTFYCSQMPFEQAKMIVEKYTDEEIIRCFTGSDLKEVFFQYLDISGHHIRYEKVTDMQPGQDAIVFKLYVTPSETQPIIYDETKDENFEAKKIQNIYVHCQYIYREK